MAELYFKASTAVKPEVLGVSLSVPRAPFSVLQALVGSQVLSGQAGSTSAPPGPRRTWPGGWRRAFSRRRTKARPRAWWRALRPVREQLLPLAPAPDHASSCAGRTEVPSSHGAQSQGAGPKMQRHRRHAGAEKRGQCVRRRIRVLLAEVRR